MMTDFQFMLCLVVTLIQPCFCGQLKKFQSNGRVSGVSAMETVHSLSECAVLFENSLNSNSINFNEDDNMCELSENYPEGFTETAEDWEVYAKIVDGTWSPWMNWDTCSSTCTGGTRTRSRVCNNPSPSNGGAPCSGPSTEDEICNENFCLEDYIFGEDEVSWYSAKTACEEMSARLVIIGSQEEIDFLHNIVQDFRHWIGMTCNKGTDCTWIDGRSIYGGFQAWAPGEPRASDCVWIGYYGNKWDDAGCDGKFNYICEIL